MSPYEDRLCGELEEKFPKLFKGYNLGVSYGDGWHKILLELCSKLMVIVNNPKYANASINIAQIKEKFGTLRVYVDISSDTYSKEFIDEIDLAIGEAEVESGATCEICGSFGSLRLGGWLKTRCDFHADGRPVVAL